MIAQQWLNNSVGKRSYPIITMVFVVFLHYSTTFAIYHPDNPLQTFDRSQPIYSRIIALERLVDFYMDHKPDSALLFAWQIYTIAQEQPQNTSMQAITLSALVNAHTHDDKAEKVLPFAFRLLRLSEEIQDTAKLARALFAIGHASGQLSTKNDPNENSEAQKYLYRALYLAYRQNNTRLIMDCYNALGRIFRKELQFDSAMVHHNKALELANTYRIPFQQGWALHGLALCYEQQGNHRQALRLALEGLQFREQVGNPKMIAISLNGIAGLYQTMGNLDQALKYAQRSLATAEKIGSRLAYHQSLERIAKIYEDKGDFYHALLFQKRFIVLRDSIAKLERTDDLRSLQAELKLEHHEREKNLLLKQQEAQRLAIQRQQIIVIIVVLCLILFAITIFLLLRARRAIQRRNAQILSAKHNIEQQMRVEAAKNLEISKLQRILDESADYIVMWEVGTGNILYMNKSYRQLTGLETPPDAITNLIHRVSANQQSASTFFEQIAIVIEKGILSGESTMLNHQGEQIPVIHTTICHKDPYGNPALLSSIIINITEQKHTEQLLRAQHEEILRQKEFMEEQARDIEITNSQLEALNEVLTNQNAQLIALNEEKNELMNIVAHDLKNPIGTILGYTVLLENEDCSQDEKTMFVKKILGTGNRMLHLVQNILNVNQFEQGQIAIHIIPLNVVWIVRSVVYNYHSKASEKSITFHNTAEQDEMYALADEPLLHQVFENLVSNAVKYSPPGKRIYTEIRYHHYTNNDSTIRITIRDEGPGLTESDKKRLFGKFARLSAQPTGGEHSTGLGLNIVKKLVEKMSGKVWCESEYGQGAAFIVELPIP